MTTEDEYSDLSFVSTPDLVKELSKRFETLVLLGHKPADEQGSMVTGDFMIGNPYACLGMVAAKYGEMILAQANEDPS